MADPSRSYGQPAPSPLIPLFLVSVIVGMVILPWLISYMSAISLALQQMNFIVILAPLLIILGISLISVYQKWMYPTPSVHQARNREWRNSSTVRDDVLGSHHGDGTGVGLFILLVFALVLIPWR